MISEYVRYAKRIKRSTRIKSQNILSACFVKNEKKKRICPKVLIHDKYIRATLMKPWCSLY